ncbi:MAG: D-tyrosyl-tRNA(Tyr) deacylase [Chloroflexi bacterium]|nr:D-tyrosyl-tRNA(Tyr) deacylase [Chloroflexota bacterium]
MKALIQRVSSGSVEVDKKIVGSINKGLVIFIGITHNDSEKEINYLTNKILNLRIFGDENTDNFEKSVLDNQGELLIISQFTLYGDTKKGRRPSFVNSAKSDYAYQIYNKFVEKLREEQIKVETGIFGAKMTVNIVNEGPVTLILDSN